jgi:uncharacterized protein (DUF58 family)
VGAFFAAAYANLLFLLLCFASVLGLLNALGARSNLRGVAGAIGAIAPVPAGAGADLAVRLDDGGRRRFGLTVELEIEGGPRLALPDGKGRLPPLLRGLYPIRRASVVSSWPMGLFAARRLLPAPPEIVVFPAPLRADARGSGGEGTATAAAGMLQPSGLREYRPGDEPRHIHWKASARRGAPVLKEWEGGAGEGIELLLDRRMAPEPFERALSRLSALVLEAKERQEPLTLHTQGLSASFGGSHRPWNDLLRFLAGLRALPADGPPPPAPASAARVA